MPASSGTSANVRGVICRPLLRFAVREAGHGNAREPQDRFRMPEQHALEGACGERCQLRVAQRPHARRSPARDDQAHLADGFARGDAANQLAARSVDAEAAADHEVDGIGRRAGLEQDAAARQGHPLELGDRGIDDAFRKAGKQRERREHRPGIGPRVDLGPVVLGVHGSGTIARSIAAARIAAHDCDGPQAAGAHLEGGRGDSPRRSRELRRHRAARRRRRGARASSAMRSRSRPRASSCPGIAC